MSTKINVALLLLAIMLLAWLNRDPLSWVAATLWG